MKRTLGEPSPAALPQVRCQSTLPRFGIAVYVWYRLEGKNVRQQIGFCTGFMEASNHDFRERSQEKGGSNNANIGDGAHVG